ncbi:SCO family protein [bacterium]|nr:SCO family protein [bacterium]
MRSLSFSLLTFFLVVAVHLPAGAEEMSSAKPQKSDQLEGAMAHGGHDHQAMEMASKSDIEIGVIERLGSKVPPDLAFVDEQGRRLLLGEKITKPTLVLPVFYSCAVTCTLMLGNLADAINRVPLELGKDYGVLALSFDEEEGTELALEAKVNHTKILKKGLPRDEWSFLTGEKASVLSFTDAIGFKFKRMGEHSFVHPSVLVALAPDGTIIRYLYGPRFLPFDIGMALTEAAEGTPGLSIRKLLTYCFDYEPKSRTYVFRSFRLLALGIVTLLLAFFFFVLRKKAT